MKRTAILIAALLGWVIPVSAQKVSVSTNTVDWGYFLTPNAEMQYAVGQHWSLDAGARFNAWSWRTAGTFDQRQQGEMKARQQTYYAGGRWWPWNVYSGWWAGAKLQYSEYDNGGIGFLPWIPDNEAGNAFGMGLWGGYSHQLSPHWDLDMGLGVWGGWKKYTTYECPWCGRRKESGEKVFFLPSDAMISLMYIF